MNPPLKPDERVLWQNERGGISCFVASVLSIAIFFGALWGILALSTSGEVWQRYLVEQMGIAAAAFVSVLLLFIAVGTRPQSAFRIFLTNKRLLWLSKTGELLREIPIEQIESVAEADNERLRLVVDGKEAWIKESNGKALLHLLQEKRSN